MRLLAALLCLLCAAAAAQEGSFVFTRETLRLQTQNDATMVERDLMVQVRPYRILEEQDSFTLQLDGKNGLLLFLPPEREHILPGNIYAAADIAVIGHAGSVLQIWPDIVLSEQAYALPLPHGSHALLLLRSGAAVTLGIKPGTRVLHGWFQAPPEILQ